MVSLRCRRDSVVSLGQPVGAGAWPAAVVASMDALAARAQACQGRHAQAAGLVGAGMTSGHNMHRARHSFASDLRRVADLGATSQALGHSDLSTTAAIYGHYDLSDLERAMDALARARREREEPAD